MIRRARWATFLIVSALASCRADAPTSPTGQIDQPPARTLALAAMTSSASNSSLSPRAAVTFTSIPGLNRAFGINADGLVVGDYGGNNIAGVWSGAEGFRSVGRLDGSTACCSALSAVNAAGVGVGFSHTDAGVSPTEWSAAGGSIDLQIPAARTPRTSTPRAT